MTQYWIAYLNQLHNYVIQEISFIQNMFYSQLVILCTLITNRVSGQFAILKKCINLVCLIEEDW